MTFVGLRLVRFYLRMFFLDKVHFEEAEFFHTSLRQIDFSTCFIEGTLFDYTSVQGMIIDMFQSPTIVRLLGVKIKDDLS